RSSCPLALKRSNATTPMLKCISTTPATLHWKPTIKKLLAPFAISWAASSPQRQPLHRNTCLRDRDQSLRMQRLARDPFIAHSEVINERRRNRGGLLQVVFEDVVVAVYIRVRRPRVVTLHIVSYPLEGGQVHFIKLDVVGGPDFSDRQCGSAEISVRIEQVAENRPGGLVALQVKSANAARA